MQNWQTQLLILVLLMFITQTATLAQATEIQGLTTTLPADDGGSSLASELYRGVLLFTLAIIFAVTTLAGLFGVKAANGVPLAALEKGALTIAGIGTSWTPDTWDDEMLIQLAQRRGYRVEKGVGMLIFHEPAPSQEIMPEGTLDGSAAG